MKQAVTQPPMPHLPMINLWASYRTQPTWADQRKAEEADSSKQWLQACTIVHTAAKLGSQDEATAYWRGELIRIQQAHGIVWRKIVGHRAKQVFTDNPSKLLYND